MNNFPYTNPYTQNPSCSQRPTTSTRTTTTSSLSSSSFKHKTITNVEDLLEQLETTSSTQQQSVLLQHHTSLVASLEWNLSTAIRLVDWVLGQFFRHDRCSSSNSSSTTKHHDNDKNNNWTATTTRILAFLHACFHLWDDRVVYAALVHSADDNVGNNSQGTATATLMQQLERFCLLHNTSFDRTSDEGDDEDKLNHYARASTTTTAEKNDTSSFHLRAMALSTLVLAWEVLDRLHQITTLLSNSNSNNMNAGLAGWWIPHDIEKNTLWQQLLRTVVQQQQQEWNNNSNNHSLSLDASSSSLIQNSFLRPEEWKAACMSLLVQLLQHGHVDWMFALSDQELDQWQHDLAKEAARLKDPNMPASSYTRLSLVSLQLWMVLHQVRGLSLANDASTTAFLLQVMDPVITAALGEGRMMLLSPPMTMTTTTMNPCPRWTQLQHTSLPISQWSYSVLQTLCQSSSLFGALQEQILQQYPCLQQCANKAWEILLSMSGSGGGGGGTTRTSDQKHVPNNDLEKCDIAAKHLFLLHRVFRSMTRDSLKQVVEKRRREQQQQQQQQQSNQQHAIEPYQHIPIILLFLIRSKDSLWAAGFLSQLLNEHSSPVLNDDISRRMWTAIDTRFLTQCMELLLTRPSRSSASDFHGPKTICLMDCLFVALTLDQQLCQTVLSTLSAEAVESFVNILCPKMMRLEITKDDCPDEYARPVDSEESTPPANNLSRMTDVSICVEEDQSPRGMDLMIRLSTAAVLAALGTAKQMQQQQEVRTALLQQRMCEPLFSFLADINLTMTTTTRGFYEGSSLEMARRRLRFIAAFANPEYEEQLSMSLHATEHAQKQAVQGIFKKLDRCSKELKESRKREQKLRDEKELGERRLAQQSLMYTRQKNDLERKIRLESKQQIAVQREECAKAEKLATDLEQRYDQVSARVHEAETSLQSCRESEKRAQLQVKEFSNRIAELEQRERTLRERLEAKEKELNRTMADAQASQSELKKAFKNITTLEDRVQQQKEIIAAADESETRMRDSLENLFADMVSLAQIYEVKEREAASLKANGTAAVEELKHKLLAEKKHNTGIKEQLDQVRYENDVLSQKYARLREQLEREQKTRQRETELRKRKGSTSYLNQLNISTTSGKSSKGGRRIEGKENEMSYRSTSSTYRSHSGPYR